MDRDEWLSRVSVNVNQRGHHTATWDTGSAQLLGPAEPTALTVAV